jgi:hypothetical protein
MAPGASRYAFREAPGPNGELPTTPFMAKDGWYVEFEQPIGRYVELIARWDGLHRIGNVTPTSPLDVDAGMMRWTLGSQFSIMRNFRVKASVELYNLWGVRNAPDLAFAAHLSTVMSF